MNTFSLYINVMFIGGISHTEIPQRKAGNCSVPGINQYGFHEYVAMSEGMFSSRYWTQQRKETYAKGANYLYHNDEVIPPIKHPRLLTDKQTDEALRIIEEQVKIKQPFFLNLWYDAPHSPWEAMEPFYSQYTNTFPSELVRKYASMISNMDMNIGRILNLLIKLKIEEETFIFFTSDNGPENDVGFTGPYKGRKRLLTEGGIRVPAIAYWKSKIKPQSTSNAFLLTTDIFPTFIHAIHAQMPSTLRIDGISFLPVLLQDKTTIKKYGDERLVLFYTHSIGYPKFTAAWAFGYKIIWNDYEGRKGKALPPSWRIFDMYEDPTENNNLYPQFMKHCSSLRQLLFSPMGISIDFVTIKKNHQVDGISLHLIHHLIILMYLFRFDGEQNWLIYHANKPFETNAHCRIQTLETADQLSFVHPILFPHFCGDSLIAEESRECACNSNINCISSWYSDSTSIDWVESKVYSGLSHYAPMMGSMFTYLQSILKWTHFQSICPIEEMNELPSTIKGITTPPPPTTTATGSAAILPSTMTPQTSSASVSTYSLIDGLTRSSFKNMNNISPHCYHILSRQDSTGNNRCWENDGLVGGENLIGNWSQRQCHGRVHYNLETQEYYLTGTSTCAQDRPLAIINLPGMPYPITLCAPSLERFLTTVASENYMDDNAVVSIVSMVALSTGKSLKNFLFI
jgi:hypothetical protein